MALGIDEIRSAVAAGTIDTVIVAFTDLYGRLMGKRFDADMFVDSAVADGTHGCDYLFTVDMEMDVIGGYQFANWNTGYGDVHLVPDLGTLRVAGWTTGAAIVLCDVVDDRTGTLVDVAPRTILKRQIERLTSHQLRAKAASELEFYLYRDSYRAAHDADYRGLSAAGWYSEDYHLLQGARVEPYVGAARRALAATGIPVENSKGETGVGQHELNIRYSEVLEMADRHTIMKHAMKELADAQGVSVTFMAKPSASDAGSSSHIHLSLWSDGAAGIESNVFTAADGGRSATFERFLAGWMAYVSDFTVCYAPTINSYKRFVDASWAPTRVAWSTDNRTAGFRVVGHGPSLRIENRIPGADCNPYLVYAASLASGLAGIDAELPLPAEFAGDAYTGDAPKVATTLRDATDAFAASTMARAAFGDTVVDHYTHFHRTEVARHDAAVTDWERRRYFERI